MKVVVSIDEHCFFYKGLYYVNDLGFTLIERYLSVFDSIRLVVRVANVEILDLDKHKSICTKKVEIFPIVFFQGYKEYIKKYFQVHRQTREATNDCAVAIIRLPSTIGFKVMNHLQKKKNSFIALEIVANPKELSQQSMGYGAKFFFKLMHHQLKSAVRKAKAISYVTKYTLQKDYPVSNPDCFTTHYSSVKIDNSYFKGAKQYQERFQNEFVIAHVAHPIKTYDKGHKILIQILKELKDQGHTNVKIKFAGDGELVSTFKIYAESLDIADQVEFVGFLPLDGLFHFLNKADMMVFPTLSEGLPRVLIEAMAVGLPCLATPVGGIPELLTPNLMFNPDDIQSVVSKIIKLMETPEMYNAAAQSCFETSQQYSESALQAKRVQFFQKIQSFLN